MQAAICKLKCNEAKVKFPNKGSCITHSSQWGLICPLSNSAHGPWRDFCQRSSQHCLSRWCVPNFLVRLRNSENGDPLSRPKITSQRLIKYVLIHPKKKSLTGLNYLKVRREFQSIIYLSDSCNCFLCTYLALVVYKNSLIILTV